MAGGKFLDSTKKSLRGGRCDERQVVIESFFVYLRRHGWVLHDRFYLGSKDEEPVPVIKVKRLDAGAIARQHQLFAVSVPQSDRVITFDILNKVQAAFFVEMEDRFRISARSIDMAALFQSLAEACMIVNLAVENQPHAIGAAMHRLMARFGQIDDRQTSKAETASGFIKDEFARIVRSAVSHYIAHRSEQPRRDIAARCAVLPDSADSAHDVTLPST